MARCARWWWWGLASVTRCGVCALLHALGEGPAARLGRRNTQQQQQRRLILIILLRLCWGGLPQDFNVLNYQPGQHYNSHMVSRW